MTINLSIPLTNFPRIGERPLALLTVTSGGPRESGRGGHQQELCV